jgi:hypothetical protein
VNRVYKNLGEFIKVTFPNTYQEKKRAADISLESFIKKSSQDFKLRIDNIIKKGQKPNGA